MSRVKTKKSLFPPLTLAMMFCAFVFSSAVQGSESAPILSLFQAIDERLGYMEDVALFKAQNQIPVEDIEREKTVLSDAKKLAVSHGLDPNSMERFFIAQIDAAKAIQYRYKAEALTRAIPTRSINLQSELRPALDRLGSDIVTLFAAHLQSRYPIEEENRTLFTRTLQSRLLADSEKNTLFDAMLEVRIQQ